MRSRLLCLLLAALSAPLCAAESPRFKVTVTKPQDSVVVMVERETVVFTVTSPSGIDFYRR